MKKNLTVARILLIALALFTQIGCSSAGETKAEEKDKTPKASVSGSKLEHLTYATFLDKIWNFEEHPQEWVYKSELPAIIDFYADWCAPCKRIAPIMEKLAKTYEGRIRIYKINVDNERKLASVFKVQSIPAVLFTPLKGQPMMQAGALTEDMYVKIIEEQLLKK
ncbi:MAG: redoxin domain-containing protein [Bacteroidales bacterium]|nr:redoxin domain-containing protein [Bacteroidales bacterium]